MAKSLVPKGVAMYKKKDRNQLNVYDFVLPFGGHLREDNRWVKLRKIIDWEMIESEYLKSFENPNVGNDGYDSDIVFGSLYIQRKLGLRDREVVNQIAENPYMQYFIGYKEYNDKMPFDASSLVHFRKRLSGETMERIIENMFLKETFEEQEDESKPPPDSTTKNANDTDSKIKNQGTLIVDATCVPADVAYPTDLELCDKARQWLERIFDRLWLTYGIIPDKYPKKPRTYRKTARYRFLKINKRRRKLVKKIRKEIRYQLNCIQRDLGYIEDYLMIFGATCLSKTEVERLVTIMKFYEQQRYMNDTKKTSVKDRIVSLSQPWIRPIVRGKAKSPTEFGVKISISVVNGFSFLDRFSFDAYNEGENSEFEHVVEKYKERFGYYPERVLADKIYRTSHNRKFCKQHGIKLSGPKLGRRGKNYAEELKKELKEVGERNEVEGKFGTAKRKLDMDRAFAKLEETTKTMICMDLFILNTETLYRRVIREEKERAKSKLEECETIDFTGQDGTETQRSVA